MPSRNMPLLWLALASSALAQSQAEQNLTNNVIAAHGLVMAIAFAVLYPIGALIIRLLNLKGSIWIHAAWQAFTYLCVLAGLGMGAWIATTQSEWLGPLPSGRNNGHPIIGLIIAGTLLSMPVTGYVHHVVFKGNGSRSIWSYTHIWIGRAMVVLGIINGGLGIQLAGGPSWAIPAYSVVAVVFFMAWAGAALSHAMKRSKVIDEKD